MWDEDEQGIGEEHRDSDYAERAAIAYVEASEQHDWPDEQLEAHADRVARASGHTHGGEVTILVADEFVGKVWRTDGEQWASEPYPDIYRWRVRQVDCHSLEDLAVEVGRAARFGRACIVRGQPLEHYGDEPVRRLVYTCTRTGDPPTFRPYEEGLRWMCIDVDGIPTDVDPHTDPDGFADAARQELGGALASGRCFYQLSASAGMKPGARVHLWYWLSERSHDDALRAWADEVDHVDASLFGSVQPHYVAAPRFIAPRPDWGERTLLDPIEQRTGWLDGTETVWPEGLMTAVKWSAYLELQEEERQMRERTRSSRASRMWDSYRTSPRAQEKRATGAIEASVAEIEGAREGGRNAAICRRANFLGRVCASGALSLDEAREALISAARTALGADWSAREQRTIASIERCLETGLMEGDTDV